MQEEESSRRGEDSTDEEGARSSPEEQSYMRDVYSEQAEPLVVPDREDLSWSGQLTLVCGQQH